MHDNNIAKRVVNNWPLLTETHAIVSVQKSDPGHDFWNACVSVRYQESKSLSDEPSVDGILHEDSG